ncbi:MAG: hypothetical protein KJ915_12025 [Candidatus Omnitrophica bacterium]|nr:hypothetical protein [Candidatus Omnitrophota bacterium]
MKKCPVCRISVNDNELIKTSTVDLLSLVSFVKVCKKCYAKFQRKQRLTYLLFAVFSVAGIMPLRLLGWGQNFVIYFLFCAILLVLFAFSVKSPKIEDVKEMEKFLFKGQSRRDVLEVLGRPVLVAGKKNTIKYYDEKRKKILEIEFGEKSILEEYRITEDKGGTSR